MAGSFYEGVVVVSGNKAFDLRYHLNPMCPDEWFEEEEELMNHDQQDTLENVVQKMAA